MKEAWASQGSTYNSFYHAIGERTDARIGIFAFDLALVRSRATVDLLLYAARRGMLIESCLLARSILEQFAYAVAVWNAETDEGVFDYQPQTKIGSLQKVYPSAKRAYGLLSRLAHYNPEEHYQFIGNAEGSHVVQRSWKFKIAAVAWFIFILDLKFKVFEFAYGNHEKFEHCLLRRYCSDNITLFDNIFEDVDLPAVQRVRNLMSQSEIGSS